MLVAYPGRAVLVAVLVCAAGVEAQASAARIAPSTPGATRAQLTALLDSLQRAEAAKTGKPADQRDRAAKIAAIRTRLSEGDFRVGDRFLLNAVGGSDQRSQRAGDTVVVRDSLMVSFGNLPETSLRGLLRSELQASIERYLGTFYKEVNVHVYPLTRVSIMGAVGRPGFYALDPDKPLSDAIMTAGGPSPTAQLDKVSVYRGPERVMDVKTVSKALREGRTLDDVGLQSGDQLRVADKRQRNWAPIVQGLFIGVTALTAMLAIIRSAYSD
jgi:protein involved in polysaccharide export with SLBB domain